MGKLPHPAIPDWKTFQVGSHTPELVILQRRLEKYGLKDPWIRNEVWKYDRNLYEQGTFDKWTMFKRSTFPGLKVGFALAVITAGIATYLDNSRSHH